MRNFQWYQQTINHFRDILTPVNSWSRVCPSDLVKVQDIFLEAFWHVANFGVPSRIGLWKMHYGWYVCIDAIVHQTCETVRMAHIYNTQTVSYYYLSTSTEAKVGGTPFYIYLYSKKEDWNGL